MVERNNDNNILVAYFSYTGNTGVVANTIQQITGGDLFQIDTVQTYPTPDNRDEMGDLATKELNDGARPELSTHVDNMDDYNVIFVGFPIWWGTPPMAIFTFLEEYDFTGKTIIPFSTHGSSGLGTSERDFASTCPDATLLRGIAINGDNVGSSQKDIEEWLNGLDY